VFSGGFLWCGGEHSSCNTDSWIYVSACVAHWWGRNVNRAQTRDKDRDYVCSALGEVPGGTNLQRRGIGSERVKTGSRGLFNFGGSKSTRRNFIE
jgi:hypothetical protein